MLALQVGGILPRRKVAKATSYVARNARFLRADPWFFLMKNIARFEVARNIVARSKDLVESVLPGDRVHAGDVSARHIVRTLSSDGYFTGLMLSRPTIDELMHCARTTECYAGRDSKRPFFVDKIDAAQAESGQVIKIAGYRDSQNAWPAMRELITDPWLLSIAGAYLGCEPLYLRSELAWSFPAPTTASERVTLAQRLHCDINDYRTLKFFFYLTDVGPDDGPHCYMPKSGVPRKLRHQALGQRCASIAEQTLLDTYGNERLVTVCGSAGHGFVGDPYYFHRGTTPVGRARLLLQLEFGRRKYKTWYFNV